MIYYLASPYSHPNATMREARYEEACKAAAWMMKQGYVVFSPIAHSHPISSYLGPETLMDHGFWMNQCVPMVRRCGALWILGIDGWDTSHGVRREWQCADAWRLPITLLVPTLTGYEQHPEPEMPV